MHEAVAVVQPLVDIFRHVLGLHLLNHVVLESRISQVLVDNELHVPDEILVNLFLLLQSIYRLKEPFPEMRVNKRDKNLIVILAMSSTRCLTKNIHVLCPCRDIEACLGRS